MSEWVRPPPVPAYNYVLYLNLLKEMTMPESNTNLADFPDMMNDFKNSREHGEHPLSNGKPLSSSLDEDTGEELNSVDEDLCFVAQWECDLETGNFSMGWCHNNSDSLIMELDAIGPTDAIVKVWLNYPDDGAVECNLTWEPDFVCPTIGGKGWVPDNRNQ